MKRGLLHGFVLVASLTLNVVAVCLWYDTSRAIFLLNRIVRKYREVKCDRYLFGCKIAYKDGNGNCFAFNDKDQSWIFSSNTGCESFLFVKDRSLCRRKDPLGASHENADCKYYLCSKNISVSWMLDVFGNCTNVVLRYNGLPCLVDESGDGRLEPVDCSAGRSPSGLRKSAGFCNANSLVAPSRRIPAVPSPAAANISPATANALEARPPAVASRMERARAAADKNQAMDALLGGDAIPADYGERMVALFRDGEAFFKRKMVWLHREIGAARMHELGFGTRGQFASAQAKLVYGSLPESATPGGATPSETGSN